MSDRPLFSHDIIEGSQTNVISQAIRQNDKTTFLRYLRKRKRNTYPLPADNQGWTALHVAASMPQCKDYLELLFQYGDGKLIDINGRTLLGETALLIACKNGCEENVEILLQNGCDPYCPNLKDDTPLLAAIRVESMKIIKFLLNYPKIIYWEVLSGCVPLLHASALSGHLEISRFLLEKGADVRSKDADNSLALHVACQNNRFEIACLLLKEDPTTINCQNDAGITPLMLAVEKCDIKFVNFLLENGATADISDKKGRMALHCAANRGDVELLQLFLQVTDASSPCLLRTPDLLKGPGPFCSLTCCAIASKSVKCLEVLLSSKLSKSILTTPCIDQSNSLHFIFSPLVYLFEKITEDDELLNSFLQLLLKHEITMVNESFSPYQITSRYYEPVIFNPFSKIVEKPISEQHYYFNLLNANGVNLDYNLQCFYDKSQPFDTFTDYENWYVAMYDVLSSVPEPPVDTRLEILKLLMSNSDILEPDIVCVQFNPIPEFTNNMITISEKLKYLEKYRELFQYLISLKPVYFTRFQLRSRSNRIFPRFPFATLQEEFSKSTLQQLCRTVIRHHLRDHTLEDNLRNFRRKIMELPLPTSLKDYLLFKEKC